MLAKFSTSVQFHLHANADLFTVIQRWLLSCLKYLNSTKNLQLPKGWGGGGGSIQHHPVLQTCTKCQTWTATSCPALMSEHICTDCCQLALYLDWCVAQTPFSLTSIKLWGWRGASEEIGTSYRRNATAVSAFQASLTATGNPPSC